MVWHYDTMVQDYYQQKNDTLLWHILRVKYQKPGEIKDEPTIKRLSLHLPIAPIVVQQD